MQLKGKLKGNYKAWISINIGFQIFVLLNSETRTLDGRQHTTYSDGDLLGWRSHQQLRVLTWIHPHQRLDNFKLLKNYRNVISRKLKGPKQSKLKARFAISQITLRASHYWVRNFNLREVFSSNFQKINIEKSRITKTKRVSDSTQLYGFRFYGISDICLTNFEKIIRKTSCLENYKRAIRWFQQ